MSALRCLWASVTCVRLYGRSSSVPKPGIQRFQLRSRNNCTSLTSTLLSRFGGPFWMRCLAKRHDPLITFSTNSSAICSRQSSTSSSSCSFGSTSRTSSCSRGFVRSWKVKMKPHLKCKQTFQAKTYKCRIFRSRASFCLPSISHHRRRAL